MKPATSTAAPARAPEPLPRPVARAVPYTATVRPQRLVSLVVLALLASRPAIAATPLANYLAAPSVVHVACAGSVAALQVTWYFPRAQQPAGLVWVQHGFFRANQNMADFARRMAAAGFMVFAPTIASFDPPCTFNNVVDFIPNLAPLFADLAGPTSELLRSARAAAARVGLTVAALPRRLVFSGHSAGGAAATLVAKEYVTRFPASAGRLRGLVLLDPVENIAQSMAASLPSLGSVPILTVSAPPSACNAGATGTDTLLALGRPFVGFEVTSGSHCDAEGGSGNPVLCGLVCGAVRLVNVGVLQIFAVGWTADLLLGQRTAALYPGGDFYDAVASAGAIRTY